ncbi:MAG: RluA family pseudouridine synthase [Aquabacterium sp.]
MRGRRDAEAAGPSIRDEHAPAVRWLTIDEGHAGQRLDNYLIGLLKGVPKTHVYRVIRAGEVRVNKGRAGADTRLAIGDVVRVPPVRLPERPAVTPAPAREFPVLLEDEHVLAIAKPAGVAVHGGSGVSFGVIEQLRQARPQARFLELVHRLDRDTSGVLLLAKRRSALTHLQAQFRERGTDKRYDALVIGRWNPKQRVIDAPLQRYLTAEGERRVREDAEGARAITLVHVAQAFERFTLLDVTIRTGRTHQIRVHLAQAGCAIVGDDKYGDFGLNKALAAGRLPGLHGAPLPRFGRMFLHARELAFDHPADGRRVALSAALPGECATLLAAL